MKNNNKEIKKKKLKQYEYLIKQFKISEKEAFKIIFNW